MRGTKCWFKINNGLIIGVIGDLSHNRNEYAIVDTLFDRSKLLATAVLKIREFENQSSICGFQAASI